MAHLCPHCGGVCRCHDDDDLEVSGARGDCEHCEPAQAGGNGGDDELGLDDDEEEGFRDPPDLDENDFDDVEDPEDNDAIYA